MRPRRQRLDKNELIFYLLISQLFRSNHSVYWFQNVLKLNILHQSSIPYNKYTKTLPPSHALSKNTELNLVIWRCCFAEDSKLMYKRFITHVNDHCSDHLTVCTAFVGQRSRCRCRRGFRKFSNLYLYQIMNASPCRRHTNNFALML